MDSRLERPVLLFDGICNLCNRAVQFVIKHDRKKRFLFASLQSETGRKLIQNYAAGGKVVPDSMVLYYKGRFYTRSGAALRCAALLGGWPSVFAAGLIVPLFIRNIVYDWVAAKRYSWFGKKDECMMPAPDLKERFLP